MLSVEEALERILGFFDVLDPEEKPIVEALGQVLSDDVVGPFDIPPWDNSAMDGYAVQARSVQSASPGSPAVLPVTGVVAAGRFPENDVGDGNAVRIMTGAPLPNGADAVVPFEDTDEMDRVSPGGTPSEIGIHVAPGVSANVRRAGRDVKKGERVLKRGTPLRPADIGVLASLGYARVNVVRRPRVAILATGDELIEPEARPVRGKIYNSNSPALASAVLRAGGIPQVLGIAGDDLESITSKLRLGLRSDILVTSAGVSKGDYDVVKDVLARQGKIEFWSVRMRPAKPLAFGVLSGHEDREIPMLGLPGNPVSALVAFDQFGRAAISKMLGKGARKRPTVRAILEDPIHNDDGRRVYARVVVTKRDGTYYARSTGDQSSNLLTSLSRANGLAICPEDIARKDAGQTVDVVMTDWPEDVL